MKATVLFLAAILATPFGQQTNPFKQSPAEHIIITIEDPFEVRSIRGTVTEAVGDSSPLPDVTFEVRGPGTKGKVKGAVTNEHGQFKIDHLPEGTYEFKATLNGWQSVEGKIVLSNKAPRHNRIRIEMRLGV